MNKLTPEAAEALEASIQHWKDNVEASRPELASTMGSDCALCDVFADQESPEDTSDEDWQDVCYG